MTFCKCDKCGSDTVHEEYFLFVKYSGLYQRVDLCERCADLFKDWLHTETKIVKGE